LIGLTLDGDVVGAVVFIPFADSGFPKVLDCISDF
jgi:hypothetical protein